MADLVALKTTLRDLERQTREARDAYYVALIEDFGLKEGDEIEAQFYGNEPFQPVIVRSVAVKFDRVTVNVSVKTKAGWSKAIRDASTLRFNGKEVAGR